MVRGALQVDKVYTDTYVAIRPIEARMKSAAGAVMAASLIPDWFLDKVREAAFAAAINLKRQVFVPMALRLTMKERLGFLSGHLDEPHSGEC